MNVMCLTNVVASNFTANCLLAIGARPIMVANPDEAEELAGIAEATLINIGTADDRQVEAMRRAIAACKAKNRPWVLDPVGCQALTYLGALAKEFLALRPTLVRGNHDELNWLKPDVPYLSTGEVDDANGKKIVGGVKMLSQVTATGCAQGAICAAFLARGDSAYAAAENASMLMKKAGELAWAKTKAVGSFQIALIDALWELSQKSLSVIKS